MKYLILIFALAFSLTACKTQQNTNTTQQKTPENRKIDLKILMVNKDLQVLKTFLKWIAMEMVNYLKLK